MHGAEPPEIRSFVAALLHVVALTGEDRELEVVVSVVPPGPVRRTEHVRRRRQPQRVRILYPLALDGLHEGPGHDDLPPFRRDVRVDVLQNVLAALALEIPGLVGRLVVHHALVPAVFEDEAGRSGRHIAADHGDGPAGIQRHLDLVALGEQVVQLALGLRPLQLGRADEADVDAPQPA